MRGGGAGSSRGVAVLAWGCNGVVPAGGGGAQAWDAGLTAIEATLDTAVTVGCLIVAPRAGTLRNLFGRISAALGAGVTVRCTVRVNQANQALTFDYVGGGGQVTGSDLVNSVAVAAGDMIAIGLTRVAGVPGAPRYNFSMELV